MPGDEQHPKKVSDSSSLTDILIQVEDFFDSLDLYVFKNWFDGEIVDGPEVRRYWVGITLQFDYTDMPDPLGGARLCARGCEVYYQKAKKEEPVEIVTPDDFRQDGRHAKPEMELKDIWLVEIRVPRRFINDVDASDLELASENDIEEEDVVDAQDEDIDAEAPFTDDGGEDASGDEAPAEGEDEEQA